MSVGVKRRRESEDLEELETEMRAQSEENAKLKDDLEASRQMIKSLAKQA